MKICATCKKELPFGSFHKKADAKDGHHPNCKDCKSTQYRKWRSDNIERITEYEKARAKTPERRKLANDYYYANKEACLDRMKNYAAGKKDVVSRAKKAYKARNPAKTLADTRLRQTRKLQAAPKWANKFFIEEIYDLARLRGEMTKIEWHVDHIVPLQSKLVCGLHCEANLQVIPASQNMTKGNRSWPDMW